MTQNILAITPRSPLMKFEWKLRTSCDEFLFLNFAKARTHGSANSRNREFARGNRSELLVAISSCLMLNIPLLNAEVKA